MKRSPKRRLSQLFAATLTLLASPLSLADDIDDFLRQTMQNKHIPGLQLAIVKDDKIVKTANYGIANIQDQVPVIDDTAFPINSMTKAFTGVAIMQLAADGKLTLADKVSRHLPDLPKDWQSVTILQLLSHTSGLPKILSGHWVDLIGNGQPESAWQEVQTLPMRFQTNTRFEYNQTGYILLGKIIDKLSGQPFVDYIRQGQLEKVSMPVTLAAGFAHTQNIVPHQARQYVLGDGGKLQNLQIAFSPMMRTAAGMSANASELARYLLALKQGKLLPPEQLNQLWTPNLLENDNTAGFNDFENGYGAGWQMIGRERHPAVSASGANASSMVYYPNDDLAIVVLTNKLGALPIQFIDEIAGFYFPDMKAENGWGMSPALYSLYQGIKAQGFERAIPLAKQLRQAQGITFDVDEINSWGYKYLFDNRLETALEVFKLNVALFPEVANGYDSLGETYAALGKREEALKNYRKVLELQPGNKNAAAQVNRLSSIK